MRRVLGLSLILASAVVLLSGCNCYNKMSKKANAIQTKCTPEMLTLKGNTVSADVTVTFPPKFFDEMAILKVTPVLVFDGGEIAGTPKFVQGEKVKDNFTVISWKEGGSYTQTVSFPYDKRANISKLYLRFEAKCSEACSKKFNDYLPLDGANAKGIAVADGISRVQNLNGEDFAVAYMADNFKRTHTITPDGPVSIMYQIGQSKVQPAELKKDQVALLEQFVKDNSGKQGVAMNSVYFNGYASPDGPISLNDKLSQARGENAKTAMVKQLPAGGKYDVAPYGEDWAGFQTLVQESNMKDKELVLQVLQMYNDPNKREQEIKNMSVVFDVLAKDILPQLRRATVTTSAEVQGLNDAELLSTFKSNPGKMGIEELLYTGSIAKTDAEKAQIYAYAAEKYNDARAYNNLGAALIEEGKYADAQKALNKAASLKSTPEVSNNLGALALAQNNYADAKKYLSSLSTPEANVNKGLIAMDEGNYAAAQKALTTGYDAAHAAFMNGDLAKAKQLLANDKSAEGAYLKAVIAARENNASGAISNLKSAIAIKPALRERAKSDIEFVKLFTNPEFKAL